MRSDIFELIGHARDLGVPTALSPAVSSSINDENLAEIKRLGVSSVSISLDGASPTTHEFVRRVEGHFERTLAAMKMLREFGIPFQVNSTVMKMNVEELPPPLQVGEGQRGGERVGGLLPHTRGPRNRAGVP